MILFKQEHVQPILEGRTTQTRRMGKKRWNVGAVHQCKTSYSSKPFATVRIESVWQEPLVDISQAAVEAEGYSNREEYIGAFARINKMSVNLAQTLAPWVVSFELVEAT